MTSFLDKNTRLSDVDIGLVEHCLGDENEEIVLSAMTTLHFILMSPQYRGQMKPREKLLNRVDKLTTSHDQRIANLANILRDDINKIQR